MKSKKRWFVTALTACLTLSLGICAEALEYDFDGVEDTECYPSTSYESLYDQEKLQMYGKIMSKW